MIGYAFFSLGMTGSPLPIWLFGDSFFTSIIEQGMSASYVQALKNFTSIGMLAAMFIATFIAALIGGWIGKKMLKKHFKYVVLLGSQYYLLPVMPTFLAVMFSVLAVYARKLLPCIMIGTLIIKTIPVRFLIVSLRKWHMPQKIIIPLSITIRYFPAIKEETTHIRDAMKMREIKGITQKISCMYVPILISAANTAEELSAAAITRGIENPTPKTCAVDIRFHMQDYICLGIGVIFVAAILML